MINQQKCLVNTNLYIIISCFVGCILVNKLRDKLVNQLQLLDQSYNAQKQRIYLLNNKILCFWICLVITSYMPNFQVWGFLPFQCYEPFIWLGMSTCIYPAKCDVEWLANCADYTVRHLIIGLWSSFKKTQTKITSH